MDLSTLKEIVIPEGKVTKIERSGVVLWSAVAEEPPQPTKIYQEVEWIQADTDVGAYLDLGFAFDTKAKVELSQYISGNANTYIFGCAENSGKLRCMITSPYYSSGKHISYPFGSTGSANLQGTGIGHNDNAWNEFEAIFEKGNLSMTNKTNGNTGNKTTQGAYTMANNLYLFAQNYNGSARFGAMRRIGYFKYYDKNDTLICDLIPCYRIADGVIGMYDKIRDIFLANVGSGTFTKGADV